MLSFEVLTEHALPTQVNCASAVEDELQEDEDDESITRQKTLAVEADDHLRAPQRN